MSELITFEATCEVCGRPDYEEEVVTVDHSFQTCTNLFRYRKSVCGHWFLSNRPMPADLDRIYPESYAAYSISTSPVVRLIRKLKSRQHLRQLKLKNLDVSVIDYGCGSGEWLSDSRVILGGSAELIGVDFSEHEPQLSKIKGFRYLNTSELSTIKDNSVDACRMIQVIEHLENIHGVLREIRRVMKPQGVLLIETPVAMGWDFKIGRDGLWGGWHAPRHFHVFSVESLRVILEDSGFEVVREKFIFGPYVWAETLKSRFASERPRVGRYLSISNPLCLVAVGVLDFVQRCLRRPTSNIRVIALSKS